MEFILALFIFFVCGALAVGSLKGFRADNVSQLNQKKVRSLERQLNDVHKTVQLLERELNSLGIDSPVESLDSDREKTESPKPEVSTDSPKRKITAESAVSKGLKPGIIIPKHIDVESTVTAAKDSLKSKPEIPEPTSKPSTLAPPRAEKKPTPKWLEQFQGMDWETFVGKYLLRVIGVAMVTVAVFLGLALAAREAGPGFRVFLGYCVSAGLLAGGRFTGKKHPGYARVVYAGGLAVAYFVTFATHYIPLARIFENPLPSLGGMAVIVGIWAAIAQKRKSPAIALLVTVLGHFTILLTTFTVPNPGMYSGFGVLLLSFGSAFFLLKNRWYYIAAVGMMASYLNHFALMTQSESQDTVMEFTIGISVLTTYLIIFALSELFSNEKLRRESIPNSFRSIFVALNSSCYFILGSLLVNGYSFTEDYHHLFRYCLAGVMTGIAILYYFRRKHDPLYNTYTAKAIALITLGLAFQFSGNTLTTTLAIEMVVLLFSSRRSGLVVTRMLAHILALITLFHGATTLLTQMNFVPYDDPAYVTTLIRTLVSVIAFGVFALVYERTDWNTRMRLGLKIPRNLHTLFGQLDFMPEPDADSKNSEKPLNGRLFPYAYSGAASLIFLGYSMRLFDIGDRFNLYAIIGAGLLALGWLLNTRTFTTASLFFVGLAALMTFDTMFNSTFPTSYIFGVTALVFCAIATEASIIPNRDALYLQRTPPAPYFLYGIALWSISLYLTHFFDDQHYTIALLALSALCGALTRRLHANALASGATVILFCAHVLWHFDYLDLGEYFANPEIQQSLTNLIAALIIILCIVGDRLCATWKLKHYGAVLIFISFTTGLHYIDQEAAANWFGFVTAAMAFGLLTYAIMTRSQAAGAFSLLTVVIASIIHVARAYNSPDSASLTATIVGFLAIIALWVLFERLNGKYTSSRDQSIQKSFTIICIATTTILSLILLERIPQLSDLYLTFSWALLAVVFFAAALLSTQKRYRYAGLAILAIATLRVVFYDTSTLDATNRVFAFGGLGVILLGLGFGYTKAFGDDPATSSDIGLEEDKDD